jgi:hypothetical protein
VECDDEKWRAQSAGAAAAAATPDHLVISFDHFFVYLSVLTTSAPELSGSRGQN